MIFLTFTCDFFNFYYGAKEIRTPDPLNAIEVRYQLRYSPAVLYVKKHMM